MTIDEAIKHCEEVAKKKVELSIVMESGPEELECYQCAEEHVQLAEWLKELKQYREVFTRILDNYNLVNGTVKDFMKIEGVRDLVSHTLALKI